jgi:predicted phosphate transport protein (TIGR00153 family)
MGKKKEHIRSPFIGALRKKSPFGQLLEHLSKVRECVDILEKGLIKYYGGDYLAFTNLVDIISKLEHEADLIEANIEHHLPRSLFMPVDRWKFLWTLREQDRILDHAENLAEMLDIRPTKIPKELQPLFMEHLKLVLKTVEVMENAVVNIKDLVESSFVKREREQTKKLIHKVHHGEWMADNKKYEITKEIYKLEKKLDPMDVYHLLKISDWVDNIADSAENVAEWLRNMIAK